MTNTKLEQTAEKHGLTRSIDGLASVVGALCALMAAEDEIAKLRKALLDLLNEPSLYAQQAARKALGLEDAA